MVCLMLQFTVGCSLTLINKRQHFSFYAVGSYYFASGFLISASSIHFLCESRRVFGMGAFIEAKHNVLLIMFTIIVGFAYTGTIMVCYGHDLGIEKSLILDNLQALLGEIAPLFVVMRIHRTIIKISKLN